jgi:hypothetical protein
MTIEKKTDVHASATDNNQHAKTETKKSQPEGPSYCEEDHEEHNHVQQVPDDVARRREMITYKKNMEVSGAGASSSSSLLEQTLSQRKPQGRRRDRKIKESWYAVSPDGDLEDVNHDQLYGAESESEESKEEEVRPGAEAVSSEGVVQLSKGHITSLVPSAAGENETSTETSTWLAPLRALGALVEALHTEEKTQNRNWYYMIGIFLVVVVAAVSAGVAVSLSGSDDDSSESESRYVDGPTSTDAQVQVAPQCDFAGIDPDITKLSDAALARYEMLLEDFAAQAVPDFAAPVNPDDCCTPTNLVLIWLASDDENSLYSEQQLINRYILGIFHVATNGFEWLNKIGWLTGVTECQWFGVTCDDGGIIITGLRLSDNGLKSTIPSEISLLSGLQTLNLERNELVGLIPTTIGALSNLSKYSVWSRERFIPFNQELSN